MAAASATDGRSDRSARTLAPDGARGPPTAAAHPTNGDTPPTDAAVDAPVAATPEADLTETLEPTTAKSARRSKIAREAELRREIADAIARTPEETQEFLARAYKALLAEGFQPTPMQFRKRGQVFGVVKAHGHELQLHVRAFDNGVIESEVELSNKYIQHLWSPRRSAHAEIARVFAKHNVETDTINTEFRTRTGAERDALPGRYTRTTDVVKGAMGIAGAVGAVAIARFIQRRGTDERRRSPWRGRRK